MDFGKALEALEDGKKVKRSFWGGYWFIPENHVVLSENNGLHDVKVMNKIIVAKLKDGGGYAPAQAYQDDLLADDWEIVE